MDNSSINSKTQSQSISSLASLSNRIDKSYDTIPFRLDFIKTLLEGKTLDPIIYDEGQETEIFINPYNGDDQSTDTVLNKKLQNFYSVINQIGGKLKYVKSGTTGHTFKGIINNADNAGINYAVKVVAYPKREKYGDIYKLDRPENAEIAMIRLLSYFVVKKQTPHIVLPIATFNTSIKPFINLIESSIVDNDNKKYKEFVEKYQKGEYHDRVSILISEWVNKGDLLDFLRNNYKSIQPEFWKTIFFQFISVLAVIQSKYPSFRHNDLKANNVLIHKVVKPKTKTTYTYIVCGQKYIVPSVGYRIKLWDFDFSCIPKIVNNIKVDSEWTAKINITPVQNRYYDMHYFFNTLIKKGFFPQFMTDNSIPQDAKDFVNRIIPKKYQDGNLVSDKGRILINDEYLTPNEVLKNDPYFKEFKVESIKKKKDNNINMSTKNKKKNIKLYSDELTIPETSE